MGVVGREHWRGIAGALILWGTWLLPALGLLLTRVDIVNGGFGHSFGFAALPPAKREEPDPVEPAPPDGPLEPDGKVCLTVILPKIFCSSFPQLL